MFTSIIGIAFDCPKENKLADFYVKISGWEKEISGDEFAAVRTPQCILLGFQTVENAAAFRMQGLATVMEPA